MAITLENIGSSNIGTNSGYVIDLILIESDDIISITDPTYDGDAEKPFTVLNGNVGISIDAKVYKFKFQTKYCSWNESSGKGIHGLRYNSSFSLTLPKNKPEIAAFFHKVRNKRFVAIWCDANGQCYITGDRDYPLQIIINRSIGNGINNSSINWGCVSWHQSWFLESIDLNLLSQSTFNEDFSEEFDVGY